MVVLAVGGRAAKVEVEAAGGRLSIVAVDGEQPGGAGAAQIHCAGVVEDQGHLGSDAGVVGQGEGGADEVVERVTYHPTVGIGIKVAPGLLLKIPLPP